MSEEISVKDLLNYIKSGDRMYLSSWQRNLSWTYMDAESLYDTMIMSMNHSYCNIDPIKIGRYSQSSNEMGLIYDINFKNPVRGTKHLKIGNEELKKIRHLQDGQQRLTSILFLGYGESWTEGKDKYYLYLDIINKEIVFDNRERTAIFDQGMATLVRTSKLFEIFMSDTPVQIKQQQCHELHFEYDNVEKIINHLLNYKIKFDTVNFQNKTEALDYFRRQNSGRALTSYQLFINKLVEFVGDNEYDRFFEECTKELNREVPYPYFPNKKGSVGKEDFSLNMMSYRTMDDKTSLKDYTLTQITRGLENEPVNEETIKAFKQKLSKYLKKLLNTKIKLQTDGLEWETCLPYHILFKSFRLPTLALIKHMGRGNGIDARTNDPLPEQAIRFIIHMLCTGNKSRQKLTPESKELFTMTNLESFSEKELTVSLDQVPIETKILLVATSINKKYKKYSVFNSLPKSFNNLTFRSEEPLVDEEHLSEIEILPSPNITNTERFLEQRRKEINDRLIKLLEKYNIRVL